MCPLAGGAAVAAPAHATSENVITTHASSAGRARRPPCRVQLTCAPCTTFPTPCAAPLRRQSPVPLGTLVGGSANARCGLLVACAGFGCESRRRDDPPLP